MRIAVWAGSLMMVASGCEDAPCDAYVDYMCACHDGEEGADCQTLRTTYEEAGPDVQDQCAIELEDQQDADEGAGEECDTGSPA